MIIKRIFLTTVGLSLVMSPAIASAIPTEDYRYQSDAGVYLGNQVAASSLFSHTLQQRKNSPGESQFWSRGSAYKTKNLSAAGGNQPIEMDRQVFMLGVDLLSLQHAKEEWTAGLMSAYGHAKTRATNSTFSSDGKVNGYSVGAYSTWYQNGIEHTGAYIDTWVQYAWFSNSVADNLTKQDYNSTNFSVSLETGYAFQPFSKLELVVEPQVQLIYNKFSTDSYRDAYGVYVQQGDVPDFTSRVGIRWYSDQDDNTTAYLATNWWHFNGKHAVDFNNSKIEARSLNDMFEVKLGLQTPSSSSMQIWFEGGSMFGPNSYQDYGASLGVSFRW